MGELTSYSPHSVKEAGGPLGTPVSAWLRAWALEPDRVEIMARANKVVRRIS